MSSINGVNNAAEMMFAQLAASKQGSQHPGKVSDASPASSGDPTDTVKLSLNAMRDEFQNARISYNEKAGNLTSDQATTLQAQIASVQSQVATDQQADGGPLTSDQKVAINQLQNQVSQQIYNMANNISVGSPDGISSSNS